MKPPETRIKHRTARNNARIGYFVKRYPSGIHRVQLRRQGFNGPFKRLAFGPKNPHGATFRATDLSLGYMNKDEAETYALLMDMKERETTLRMIQRTYMANPRMCDALAQIIATSKL